MKSKKVPNIFTILLMLTISTIAMTYVLLNIWSMMKINQTNSPTMITLEPNETLDELSNKLYEKKLISNKLLFKFLIKLQDNYQKFQAGIYSFTSPVSVNLIVSKITHGKTYQPIALEVTIPEGYRLEQIIKRLTKLGISQDKLIKYANNKTFIRTLNIESPNLEGFLFPSTYRFYFNVPNVDEIYKKMVDEFFKRIPAHYLKQLKIINLTLKEAVTIASLIEKETSIASEKPLIAEVIMNRLKKRMPLGIDASVIYGIHNFKGNLTLRHLKDYHNKYNTRIHKGLPPTPICSPSLSSLQAVINPSKKGFYYYVLLPEEKQVSHHFSKTLKEHNRYVVKLLNSPQRLD